MRITIYTQSEQPQAHSANTCCEHYSLMYLASCVHHACCTQLTFRTFNIDFDEPHHNKDHLAARLRDALMPARLAQLDNRANCMVDKTSRQFHMSVCQSARLVMCPALYDAAQAGSEQLMGIKVYKVVLAEYN